MTAAGRFATSQGRQATRPKTRPAIGSPLIEKRTMKKNVGTGDSERAYRKHRRTVRTGQALMVIGGLVALGHWIAHLAPTGQQPGITQDILIGYPTGALLFLIGAILAGQVQSRKSGQ